MRKKYHNFILSGIIILALSLRLYGINWDQGFHLHPDERAIVLSVVNLKFPATINELFRPESSWNPKFFAYGSFPFYILRMTGDAAGYLLFPAFAEYSGIQLVGRLLSSLFDVATIFMLYALGRRFFKTTIGLLAAFLYSISVLPIQLSHFYAVDTILTFFVTAVIYLSILLEETRSKKIAVLCGLTFGLALATKASAIVLIVPAAIALFYTLINKKVVHTALSLSYAIRKTISLLLLVLFTAIATFIVAEPYALIDFPNFVRETAMQSEMTKDAFVFPYTLQYVLKVPYVYELKNLFFFGLGPSIAISSFFGFFFFLYQTSREKDFTNQARSLIILGFFIVYFLIVGGFKIGFMRYLLPIYPLFCLFAAIGINTAGKYMHRLGNKLVALCSIILIPILFVWPISFMHIYTTSNTRVQATDWILRNIPSGNSIAIEHWDDALPLVGATNYATYTLPLYDPETDSKWQQIHSYLQGSDYIIIASNRLYTPLMKLTNCQALPSGRCYQTTYTYYNNLFTGRSEFQKIAEFAEYPKIPLIGTIINDETADESFTVYDHPKVMIFKRR